MIVAILAVWAAMMAIPSLWTLGTVVWLRGKSYEREQRHEEILRRKRDQEILLAIAHRKDVN